MSTLQTVVNDGVYYYSAATTSTTLIASGKWCDNPASFCAADLCCGIAEIDTSNLTNTATMDV